MWKRVMALVLCVVLISAGNAQVFAADAETAETTEISPRMDCMDSASASLSVDSAGNAAIQCSVYGHSGYTTHTEIVAKLQRYVDGKWVTLEIFSASSNSYSARLKDSYKVSKGYTYRVQAIVRAYSGSSSETRTVTSNEVKY